MKKIVKKWNEQMESSLLKKILIAPRQSLTISDHPKTIEKKILFFSIVDY